MQSMRRSRDQARLNQEYRKKKPDSVKIDQEWLQANESRAVRQQSRHAGYKQVIKSAQGVT
jgi:hypothetical protein